MPDLKMDGEMALLDLPEDREAAERIVLDTLARSTYEETSERTGWSRGKIYDAAVRHGARKHEARIRERAAERERRQAEFLEEIMHSTATADVLDFLDGLPDESVQMFVTSIPYNLGKKYGGAPGADSMRAVYYHGWLMQIISEMSRILKPGGVVFFQSGKTVDWQDNLMPIDVLVYDDFVRSGLTFQNRIMWTQPHGLTPKGRLSDRYETALVFSKGPECTFNPGAARTPQKNPGKRAYKGPNRGRLSGSPLGAHPTDVWDDLPSIRHSPPERRHSDHCAQFPVGLAMRAILLWSLPGDLICDPFNGSGSTQIGAVRSGRDFVGADLFYADTRAARLEAEGFCDLASELTGVTDDTVAVWQAEARRVDAAAQVVTDAEHKQMALDLVGGS